MNNIEIIIIYKECLMISLFLLILDKIMNFKVGKGLYIWLGLV